MRIAQVEIDIEIQCFIPHLLQQESHCHCDTAAATAFYFIKSRVQLCSSQPYVWQLLKIGKNNNTYTVQAESSKFSSLLFDQGFQIVIPPSLASVPETI